MYVLGLLMINRLTDLNSRTGPKMAVQLTVHNPKVALAQLPN